MRPFVGVRVAFHSSIYFVNEDENREWEKVPGGSTNEMGGLIRHQLGTDEPTWVMRELGLR